MRMQALDGFDANHAFMFGLVRQKRRTGDIADGVDSGHVGFAHPIDDNRAAIGFHSKFFQAEVFDIADDSDGRDDALSRERLCPTLPSSIVAVTLSDFLSSFVTLAPVKILMPCFSKLLRAKAAISVSSTGRICGNTSTTVTSAPSVRKKEANSIPIAPEPMTRSDFGIRSGTMASK